MSTNLYHVLGISKDATPADIRKAYKKGALETHPDRIRQGATPEEKALAEENFRKVNHAYEVLIDPEKRREYDIHGIWPPHQEPQRSPTAQANGSNYGRWPPRSNTFPDPFMSHGTRFPGFHFSDPFTLFEQIFAGTPFARASRHRHPFFSQPLDPFGHMHADVEDLLDELDRDPFGTRGFPSFSPFPSFPAFPSIVFSSANSGSGTRWVSESFSSSMINGATQSIQKQIDSEGNEHITRTFPDGRQIRTINGVEQPAQQRIAYPEPIQRRPSTNRYLPQPSLSPQLVQNSPRTYVTSEPPPPYPASAQSQSYYRQGDSHSQRPHHYRSREKHRPPSEHNEIPTSQDERHAHKKWLPSKRP